MDKNFLYLALNAEETKLLESLTAKMSQELNVKFTRQKFLLKLMKDYSQNLKN